MKNCVNCGQVNHDNQMNCGRCGAVLNAPNFPPNVQQPMGNQPNFQQPMGNQPNFQQQFGNQQQQAFNQPMPVMMPKKSHVGKILAIVGGSFILFALLVGGVVFLAITQSTRWKIQETWRLDSGTMGGTSVPLGAAQGTTVKFHENMTFLTTLPNGTTEHGSYRIIDEKTISTTDRTGATITSTISFDRSKMTMVSTKNNVNVTLIYYKSK